MNKKQLVAKISSSMNLSKADAERTFDGITEIKLLKGRRAGENRWFWHIQSCQKKSQIWTKSENRRTDTNSSISKSKVFTS